MCCPAISCSRHQVPTFPLLWSGRPGHLLLPVAGLLASITYFIIICTSLGISMCATMMVFPNKNEGKLGMPSQPRCSESIAVLLKDYDGNVGFMAYRKLADYGIDVTPWKTVCSA